MNLRILTVGLVAGLGAAALSACSQSSGGTDAGGGGDGGGGGGGGDGGATRLWPTDCPGYCANEDGTCSAVNCSTGCCIGLACLPGSSDNQCGINGDKCRACAIGQACSQNVCVAVDGGNNPPDAGSSVVGIPCTQDSECASLNVNFVDGGAGSGAKCKLATSQNTATYRNGYCTKVGCGASNGCPSDSRCLTGFAGFGEDNAMCLKSCSNASGCRFDAGYNCWKLTSSGSNVCWLDPMPTWDAGPPAPDGLIGSPCSYDGGSASGGCGPPPDDGFCLPEVWDGGPTGYAGGFCTAACSTSLHCGDGGLCVSFSSGSSLCEVKCNAPNGGQGECRSGYVCKGGLTSGGTPLSYGYCIPSCENAGMTCSQGYFCDAGYCRP